MHEAALARQVADQIELRGIAGRPLRLVVSGGHGDRHAFDAALRTQIAATLPTLDVAAIDIVHRAAVQLCSGCAGAYLAVPGDPCPMCGGEGVPVPQPERIELEWGEA